MEISNIFAPLVSDSEWQAIPADIGKKIHKWVNDELETLITAKALAETNRFTAESHLTELRSEYENVSAENTSLKSRLDTAVNTMNEIESQLSTVTTDLAKLQQQCNKYELEIAEYRHQRNVAVDERDEHRKMVQRRNAEIERLQADLNSFTQQLQQAVNAKCEALAQADEVASMKLTLEYKEKRLEQERVLFTSQIESLTEDLNQRTEELLNMRRDNTSRCIQLETKLAEKTQELAIATEHIKSLTELNNNMSTRNEELSTKLLNQREVDSKMNESYLYEIEAKTKMTNTYKTMCEESQQHSEELKEALVEVQDLLKTATDKYGDLETKHKEMELAHEEILAKKNECIAMLKRELNIANEVLESSSTNIPQHNEGEEFSTAASTSSSRLLKAGMTVTEVYSQFVAVSEKLANKEQECARLNNYITCIVREIEEKGPLIKKLREDYSRTLDANDALKESNDSLLNELQQLREMSGENKRMEGVTQRENQRLKKEVNDLSRQVCHLLQEVENSRTGSSSTSDMELSDSVCSADIISKKLVTFNDISEMQATNQKLLAVVRELTERQEEVESFDPAAISALKRKLEELRESQNEFLEERDKQNKMMMTLRNQRDMYKNLYTQASKSGGDDLAAQLDRPYNDDSNKTQTETDSQGDDKMHEFESQIEAHKKKLVNLKEEFEQYRNEKCANEKILVEQLESARAEVKELTKLNCKLHSHAEMNEEKFKVLQNNSDIYKKQIAALEKQNNIFSESIIKHEQAANYLKDETLQSQTKLSRAEVMLANLQKENALLRDAEGRLLKEREMLKRESHQQNMIHTNIELIKAALERADAESKLRLESRLDEAHRECSALRRRLQEEQDNFRQLSDHLKRQTEEAQRRMEEEKSQADKLRGDLIEVREELTNKSTQIEDLTKKLRLSILEIPEHNVDGRRIRELENQLADAQAEIDSLKTKFKTTKEASEQYFNVAENAEKEMKEVIEQRDGMQKEISSLQGQVKELQEKCSELQGELSIQLDDQDMANASIKSKSHQLQEELSSTVMDLQTATQQLDSLRTEYRSLSEQLKAVENKYAREVMLHSADLQELANMKENLNTVQDEVNQLRSSRDQAREALEETQRSWKEQEKIINREKESLEERFKDMETQNALLLDQIQALNTHLTVLQAQASADQSTGMGETSFNRSFTEDEVKSSEQLLKIIKYLRQEKDIAVSKADIMEAEHARLKSQFDLVCKQLEEAKVVVEHERQKSEVSVVSSSKHSEVLRKLETLNAITDSNRSLRQERDTLLKEIAEFRARVDRLETEVAPLQEKNRDLSTKADQMQSENISLRAEATRWRQRANMLIEKTNRTSPEDWKKLQNERENLAKQLTIERSTTTKLNDDINNLRTDKVKLEDQLKSLRAQNNTLTEEVTQMKDSISSLQTQHNQISLNLEQMQEENKKIVEENRILTEDRAGKDVAINELRNNLGQIRKIAKKYKTQSEEYYKELETLKQQQEEKNSEQSNVSERQEQMIQEQRSELEERVTQMEASHKEAVDQLNQQVTSSTEQIEGFKKEIENLKQTSYEKEERFKNLFKNAKERIVTLTEQNNNLKEELSKQDRQSTSAKPDEAAGEGSSKQGELLETIERLEREKEEILAERQQEKEKMTNEMETLMQRVNQLHRQLGSQQGSKPSTSSGTTEKLATEPPTANIKPMAGHSTNTQTQSVPIQPWRSVGEPPLASIRPMSAQLRTVAVLPTSQSPSAVMVPPQQQVHTTGSSTMEAALSSSPTSSHTDYVAATSSASSAMLGPRQQVAVPPTQSSQDTEDDENNIQMQSAPQQQAVALVLPRIEPPSSGGPTQEQGTSSSSSNTVTTTQAGLKRQRDADTDSQSDEQNKQRPMQQSKRTRLQQAGSISESVLEVEYQVPTSSQRDHDDDNVILVESDDEGGPDEGEGADDEQDDPDTEGYDMEGMEQDNYEDADCQDVEDEEEAGNEVEVIEDSSEVPNQSERSILDCPEEEGSEQQQSEAISSGTAEGTSSSGVTLSQASTSMTMTIPSNSRTRPVAPLPSRSQHHHHHPQQQSHLLLSSHHSGLEEAGDDGIVPSTPTLFVPRRSDGEAVSSPHVPTSGRFTFSETLPPSTHAGSSEVVPEQTLEVAQVDDNSTGRSVPTTPLQASPQESVPCGDEPGSLQNAQSDAEIPTIRIDASELSEETPSVAGPSSEGSQQPEQADEMLEGDDEVSSEGEKPLQPEEGGEEEGREAEASPSTNTRLRHLKNIPSVRRSLRSPITRGSVLRSGPPTPIIWSDPQQQQQSRQHPQQPSPHMQQQQNRGGSPVFPRAVARRARSRIQRPFGRF